MNDNAYFKYDASIPSDRLRSIEVCIGCFITSIKVEAPSVTVMPDLWIENIGKCVIELKHPSSNIRFNLTLESTYKETPPVVDSGGIKVDLQEVRPTTLTEKLKLGKTSDDLFKGYVPFYINEDSQVRDIEFYGTETHEKLDVIDPFFDKKNLTRYGYQDWPTIDIKTIEFMSINYVSGNRTILSSQQGGFFYTLLINSVDFIEDKNVFYIKPNMSSKKIELIHKVSSSKE